MITSTGEKEGISLTCLNGGEGGGGTASRNTLCRLANRQLLDEHDDDCAERMLGNNR